MWEIERERVLEIERESECGRERVSVGERELVWEIERESECGRYRERVSVGERE